MALTGGAQGVGHCSTKQKFVGLIPSQGAGAGERGDKW